MLAQERRRGAAVEVDEIEDDLQAEAVRLVAGSLDIVRGHFHFARLALLGRVEHAAGDHKLCAKACLENGIPVGLGTDTGCPYITPYDMWREVYYFHKYCGVSNAFALYTATLGNAEILGMEDEIGSIAPGKCADLIVTAANPLDDLKALRNVSMVVARGEIVDISGLKKYPAVEHELDKFLD